MLRGEPFMLKKNISNKSKEYRSATTGKFIAKETSEFCSTGASAISAKRTVNRSSVSGQFVTKSYAQSHPRTTEVQKVDFELRRSKLSAIRQKNNEKFHDTYLFLADH